MSGSAFGELALLVAVALVVFETFKSVVLEYGAVQAGRFIEWGFREHISSHTCVTIDSIDQQSVERCFSVFERQVVWSERQSYVLYFISPPSTILSISALQLYSSSVAVAGFPPPGSDTLQCTAAMAVLAPGTRILAQYSAAVGEPPHERVILAKA